MQIGLFDPVERNRVKAAARRADDADLAAGCISHIAMGERNGAFGHIDFSKARIVVGDNDPIL